jgi:hypothetical protein
VERLAAAVSDPKSPSYGRYLTAAKLWCAPPSISFFNSLIL